MDWLKADITGGLYVISECKHVTNPHTEDPINGWHLKHTYQIGFHHRKGVPTQWTMTCMADGMTTVFDSKTALATRLENFGNYKVFPVPIALLKRLFKYKLESQEYYLGKL